MMNENSEFNLSLVIECNGFPCQVNNMQPKQTQKIWSVQNPSFLTLARLFRRYVQGIILGLSEVLVELLEVSDSFR